MPKELTLTLSALSAGKGIGCVGTTSFFSTKGTRNGQINILSSVRVDLLFGLGFLNLIFGGIVLFSKARTALIRLVIPEQPSECPTFGFTDPMNTPTEDVSDCSCLDRIACRSASAVALQHVSQLLLFLEFQDVPRRKLSHADSAQPAYKPGA
jgi:hypothetical protein